MYRSAWSSGARRMTSWKGDACPREGSSALDLDVISPWEISLSLSECPGKCQVKVFIATSGRAKQSLAGPLETYCVPEK